jgi:V8-like Glu-specific endopeptidase
LVAALGAVAALAPSMAAGYTTTQLDPTTPENRMVGQLVKSDLGESCSGIVVDAPNRSTVLTAAHCVQGGDPTPKFVTFNPGFQDGTPNFGFFSGHAVLPAPQYVATGSPRYDYAFVVFGRKNITGPKLQDTVGARPIVFNQPRSGAYRMLGYPGQPNPPYNGQRLWACDTTYAGDVIFPGSGPLNITAACNFQLGASGGPWLNSGGTVVAAHAGHVQGQQINYAAYLDSDAAALFAQASSINPPAIRRHCKKKKRKKGNRAAAAKKKKKKCKRKKKKRRK